MSTLYTTGVFFILMYTGPNILPIGKFLSMTHTAVLQVERTKS